MKKNTAPKAPTLTASDRRKQTNAAARAAHMQTGYDALAKQAKDSRAAADKLAADAQANQDKADHPDTSDKDRPGLIASAQRLFSLAKAAHSKALTHENEATRIPSGKCKAAEVGHLACKCGGLHCGHSHGGK